MWPEKVVSRSPIDGRGAGPSGTESRRVLHLIPFLWSGAGDVVSRLAISQRANGPVGVVTSGRSLGESDWGDYVRRIDEASIGYENVDLFDRSPEVFWPSVRKLGAIVSRFQPEVVHCHAGVPAAAAAALRDQGHRFRLVGQLHSWGMGRPEWMNTLDLHAFGRCDAVISNADTYRSLLRESGIPASKIVSVPWGLDLDAVPCGPRDRPPRPGSRVRLGFVGRIEPRKRQLELVRALKAIGKRGLDAELDLIGPVSDREYGWRVREQSDAPGLEGRVRILGKVDSVYPYLENWDLFVSLSSDEGQGMAVLEAMASGVPVVAADAPGIRDYMRHCENGFIVPSVAPDDVAEMIEWVVEHPDRADRARREARSMVERRYGWTRTVSELDALYASVA